MLFLFWLVTWFVQLHFLDSNPWFFGVSWPIFVVLTLYLSRHFITLRLIWWLLLLGIISDLSSHMAPGLIIRGYLCLALGVALISFLSSKKLLSQFWCEGAAVVVLAGFTLLVQASSFRSLMEDLRIELWLYLVLTVAVYLLVKLADQLRSYYYI